MGQLVTITIIFLGIWAVIGIAVWQGQVTRRARIAAHESQAYRELAERFAEAERAAEAELAQIRQRLEAMEQLLNEVG